MEVEVMVMVWNFGRKDVEADVIDRLDLWIFWIWREGAHTHARG